VPVPQRGKHLPFSKSLWRERLGQTEKKDRQKGSKSPIKGAAMEGKSGKAVDDKKVRESQLKREEGKMALGRVVGELQARKNGARSELKSHAKEWQ